MEFSVFSYNVRHYTSVCLYRVCVWMCECGVNIGIKSLAVQYNVDPKHLLY